MPKKALTLDLYCCEYWDYYIWSLRLLCTENNYITVSDDLRALNMHPWTPKSSHPCITLQTMYRLWAITKSQHRRRCCNELRTYLVVWKGSSVGVEFTVWLISASAMLNGSVGCYTSLRYCYFVFLHSSQKKCSLTRSLYSQEKSFQEYSPLFTFLALTESLIIGNPTLFKKGKHYSKNARPMWDQRGLI